MIAIITSSKDIASMAIRQQLLENYGFRDTGQPFDGFPVYALPVEQEEARLFTISADSVHAEGIDKMIPAGLFIFATRHVSKAGVPALTTHSIGNWGEAQFGGREGTVCPVSPRLLKLFLQNLSAVAKSDGYSGEVVQEATHHGPYLEKPAVFIEVGSSENEWKDVKLASMVADSLIGGLGDFVAPEMQDEIGSFVPVVGLGGPHYCSTFTRLMLEREFAVGHICPKHHLPGLSEKLLRQAMAACGAEKVAVDWKSLGQEKIDVKALLDGMGVEWFRI